jgi:hypothetical protein
LKIFWHGQIVNQVASLINTAFDGIDRVWESSRMRRWIMWLLLVSFFGTLVLVEMERHHWLPALLAGVVPENHFYAVNLVFSVVLVIEVASLALSIAGSVANALGRQFEILSLILLRQAFKEFIYFNEPIEWSKVQGPIANMLSDAAGGLALFFAVWLYYRIQTHRAITNDPEERYRFVTAKKFLALLLLAVFAVMGVMHLASLLLHHEVQSGSHGFFDAFYTVLIFSDILLVLISLRYSSHYPIVFRNSGFALATVFIRLALTAPPFVNVGIALAAIAFAIGLSLAYRTFLGGAPEAASSISS